LEDRRTPTRLTTTLRCLDLNRVITGTLDSIAEQTLADFRSPGTQPPVPLEQFEADAILRRSGIWKDQRHRDANLTSFLQGASGSNAPPRTKEIVDIAREFRARFFHDQVDVVAFERAMSRQTVGAAVLCRAVEDYTSQLDDDLVVDFAGLEQTFYNRLRSGGLNRFADSLSVILVDEYQDTNSLQEQIYLAMAEPVSNRDGSITVVGDDDQSLYRFRGATVDLFAMFPDRLAAQTEQSAQTIYLLARARNLNSD